MFGSGARTKSSRSRVCQRRLRARSGDRSERVTPPMSSSASVGRVGVVGEAARSGPANVGPTCSALQVRSSTNARASGISSVSASSTSKWCTTTSRSRSSCANTSCSSRAFAAHSTSSNSNASQLPGVRRLSSSPGRWTIAWRSWPTSECTPNCRLTEDCPRRRVTAAGHRRRLAVAARRQERVRAVGRVVDRRDRGLAVLAPLHLHPDVHGNAEEEREDAEVHGLVTGSREGPERERQREQADDAVTHEVRPAHRPALHEQPVEVRRGRVEVGDHRGQHAEQHDVGEHLLEVPVAEDRQQRRRRGADDDAEDRDLPAAQLGELLREQPVRARPPSASPRRSASSRSGSRCRR